MPTHLVDMISGGGLSQWTMCERISMCNHERVLTHVTLATEASTCCNIKWVLTFSLQYSKRCPIAEGCTTVRCADPLTHPCPPLTPPHPPSPTPLTPPPPHTLCRLFLFCVCTTPLPPLFVALWSTWLAVKCFEWKR